MPGPRPTRLPRDNHRPGSPTLLRPPTAFVLRVGRFVGRLNSQLQPLSNSRSELARMWWYRNINRLCIDYASRPRLSSRLTLGGLAFPRNPWISGGRVSHPSFATHAKILTRPRSTGSYPPASLHDRRSATARQSRTRGFGTRLEPRYIVRARSLDQ